MAYTSSQSHRHTIPLIEYTKDGIAALRAAWSRYRVFVRTHNELSALTTRELDDMGISRSMITRIAREAAYGRDA